MSAVAALDVEYEAYAREHRDQRGAAVGDERQRNARQRGEPEDCADVEHRLPDVERNDACHKQLLVRRASVAGDPKACVSDDPVERE